MSDGEKLYQEDVLFAFFVANFHYTKSDYEQLTRRERTFIMKAYENKLVSDNQYLYSAVFAATYNAQRTKKQRALKLWEKEKVKKADMNIVKEAADVMAEVERKEGSSWIDKVYKANRLKLVERRT